MARVLSERLRVSGELVAESALHVGGGTAGVEADLVVARDGAGRPYVPGTSLAGALAEWCRRATAPSGSLRGAAVAAWGEPPGEGRAGGDRGSASLVIVESSPIDRGERVEVRDGVGIDRRLGTAADRTKYDRQVLPRGTRLPFRLTLEVPHESWTIRDPEDDLIELAWTPAEVKALIGSLLAALEEGELRVGAARTRGLGGVRLQGLTILTEPLDRAGILDRLRAWDDDPYKRGTPVDEPLVGRDERLRAPEELVLEIDWRPGGPVMVRAGQDGLGVDSLPLTTTGGENGGRSLVLPGSAIKGPLRARAERIVRTMLEAPLPDDYLDNALAHHVQLDVPLVRDLFGDAARNVEPAARGLTDDEAGALGRGALSVEDCHGTDELNESWDELAREPRAERVQDEARKRGIPHAAAAMHVAVDRWTGGAARGALYSVLEPLGAGFEPIRVRIDPVRLPHVEGEAVICRHCAALALLYLVFRDLRDGWIPLGYATHRGMGEVHDIRVRVVSGEAAPLPVSGGAVDLDEPTPALREAWQGWRAEASA